ncbi:M23 family metallopeptidase [Helicobacter pametensis]|uniref:M23 family metallopeptidase n=1 Tax=Helicobacter pametensis TaxID=95149 RepID=UPI0004BB9391|nr:M23 family metallopeptidase [Helicobacter pametensis]
MNHKIFISIVDEKGSKQFALHQFAKKVALYALLSLFVLVLGGSFVMMYLMSQIQEADLIKTDMIEKYRSIYLQNKTLRERIRDKSLELIDVNKRVNDLEEIIDFSKNNDKILQDEPITIQLDSSDKLFLLQIIPNGHPLKIFTKILPTKERLHPLKNQYGIDSGIDYLVPSHTPVYATADGIIELARHSSSIKGYGRLVKITHAYGFVSMYGHLSKVLVKKGDFVRKGQMIGYSGRSGASNGERLYYEIRFLGSYQDALAFAKWDREHFDQIFQASSKIHWNRLLWAIQDLKQLQSYVEREKR